MGLGEAFLLNRAVERFLKKHEVTVVLGEFLDQFVDFVPLLDRMNLPYVVQGHGFDVSVAVRNTEIVERYAAYESARAILTRCEFHRQRLIQLGLPESAIHVNYGGVDVPAEQPRREPGSAKRFLAVSNMVPKKGSIYLLEAFRHAALKDSEITLDVVGGGLLFPAVRQFVDACGLADRVQLHGVVSEEVKWRLLLECGVFVQHSITNRETGEEEGLPAAIQEAMAYGLAVVSTRHAGIPEAVKDGVTGLLVEEGNVEGMAAAMIKASSLASSLGAAGYLRARSEHSWPGEKKRLSRWLQLPNGTA
jgi:glycosyltransferase involved in cell wall biosynthesis